MRQRCSARAGTLAAGWCLGLLWAGAGLLLAGCATEDEFADLKRHMDAVRERPHRPLEPLPEFQAYEPFSYSAAGERSPFEPPETARRRAATEPDVQPDPDRPRHYLENYALGDLVMVGTLQRGQTRHALVRDAAGVVHRISPGEYMGSNHGRVVAIHEDGIELDEIVADGTGGWLQRSRTLVLGAGD